MKNKIQHYISASNLSHLQVDNGVFCACTYCFIYVFPFLIFSISPWFVSLIFFPINIYCNNWDSTCANIGIWIWACDSVVANIFFILFHNSLVFFWYSLLTWEDVYNTRAWMAIDRVSWSVWKIPKRRTLFEGRQVGIVSEIVKVRPRFVEDLLPRVGVFVVESS